MAVLRGLQLHYWESIVPGEHVLSGRLCLGLFCWCGHGGSKAISERCWPLIKGRLAGIKVRCSNP